MVGIDSNILLRILLADVVAAQDAPDQFSLVRSLVADSKERFFVNHIVIVETIWVLRQKLKHGNDAIRRQVQRLLKMSNVEVQDSATVAAALESFEAYPGDFSDHMIGQINRQNGCRTTYTFDRAASKSPHFSELKR